jgi:hypothetical protein
MSIPLLFEFVGRVGQRLVAQPAFAERRAVLGPERDRLDRIEIALGQFDRLAALLLQTGRDRRQARFVSDGR